MYIGATKEIILAHDKVIKVGVECSLKEIEEYTLLL